MKKAVMYGAGNIGRGFVGKLLSESNYDVCFIDINNEVVEKINRDKKYPVTIVSDEMTKEVEVINVRAVNGLNISQVADEIAIADIVATAVGINVLPRIIDALCEGIKRRVSVKNQPLNIIICENLINADKYLKKLIMEKIDNEYKSWVEENIGFVEAAIGRMVPVMTEEKRMGNILRVCVEPYEQLFLDIDSFVGNTPTIKKTSLFSPFDFQIEKKLYIHNMGHSMCAYLGFRKNYEYIHECVNDYEVKRKIENAMMCVAKALAKKYKQPLKSIQDYVEDLINRFSNTKLADTVERVGRDPIRKLGKGDRLIGAVLLCESQGFENDDLVEGIVAALNYNNINDEFSIKLNDQIKKNGIVSYLGKNCGLDLNSNLAKALARKYLA